MGLLLHFRMISFYFPFLLSLHRCSEASEVAAVKCQNIKQSLLESVFAICRQIGLFWTRKRREEKMATSLLRGAGFQTRSEEQRGASF